MRPRIGILALQGNVVEHERALRRLDVDPVRVKRVMDLDAAAALVIPGGESSTIRRLLAQEGLDAAIERRGRNGLPIFGTCAGLILLSNGVDDASVSTLGLLDVTVRRNSYGRQIHSFETGLDDHALGGPPLEAVFIRAPSIVDVGPAVRILARHAGVPVAVSEGRIVACSFHPELTDDLRLYAFFLRVVEAKEVG